MADTVCAISTAMGESGIGIVRLSGKDSIAIAEKIFVRSSDLKEIENRKLIYGHIMDGSEKVDEVLIAFMKAPYTYTREDMVEIYCHGGIVPVRRILELVLEKGARLADRGEFTKRAFLNGRLDLSQAEAVIDLIKAKTDESYDVSLNQLEGNLSKEVGNIRDILLNMIAHIEANIDFSDEDIEKMDYLEMENQANLVKNKIDKLLSTADRGKVLRDGLNTVILGKPNVGKSSLLNAILRENRAIVTDIPGTTRDIIEEYVNIDGIPPLRIIDTAGIRETENIVEQIGVDRARDMVNQADLVIAIFDASESLTDEDFHIIEIIKDKETIVLLNKLDLPNEYDKEYLQELIPNKEIITTSISTGIGVDKLENSIKEMFYDGEINMESDTIVTNIRHRNQLIKSRENIVDAINGIKMNVPIDCIEVDIKSCWDNLGEVTGDNIGEDILDKIFSEFCIGK